MLRANQFPIVFCLLVLFDLEFTFICSKAPRSRCNGCLRHCKPPYLACPRRISALAGSEHSLTLWHWSPGQGSARAGWRGRRSRCNAFSSLLFVAKPKPNSLTLPSKKESSPLALPLKLTHFYRVVKETMFSLWLPTSRSPLMRI